MLADVTDDHKSVRAARMMRDMTFQDCLETAKHKRAIRDNPCFYCGVRADKMHFDHRIPLARGGTNHAHNIVRACAECNLRKGALLPTEFQGEFQR